MKLSWIKTSYKQLPEDREIVLVKTAETDIPLVAYFDSSHGWTLITEKRAGCTDYRIVNMIPIVYWSRFNEEPVFFNLEDIR